MSFKREKSLNTISWVKYISVLRKKQHKLLEVTMKWKLWKNKSKDDFYVRVLRRAKEKGSEGFLLSDMDRELSLTEKQTKLI